MISFLATNFTPMYILEDVIVFFFFSNTTSKSFPQKHIQAAINKALEAPRSKALQRKDRPLKSKERMPLELILNPTLPNILSILKKKYFPILQTSDWCKKAIPTFPMAAFHRPKNLCDSLIHSSASRRDTVGSRPYSIPRCMTSTLIDSIHLPNHPQNIQHSTRPLMPLTQPHLSHYM